MKTYRLLLPALILVLFVRCSAELPATDPIFDNKVALAKRIRLSFEKSYLKKLGIGEENAGRIESFYHSRNYKPLWANDSVLNEKGATMEKITRNPCCIGIPENRWETTSAKHREIIAKELLLTAQFGLAFNDLHNGLLDTATNALKPLDWQVPSGWEKQLDTVKNWGHWFAGFGSPHREYQRIARGLFAYGFDRTFSSKTFKLPDIVKDSANCYRVAKLSLIDKGYVTEDAPDSLFLGALETFQVENGLKPDAVIGKYTRRALEESQQTKVDRAILSLERWRWRAQSPDRFIWINIPEYMLRVYYNDTLQSEHRVVVGKFDTKTPQLESRIRQIVAYPYWNVPYSITSKEFLPAAKNNPGYFARNHLRLYKRDGEEVDPYSVNWKSIPKNTFPYKVRQDPGTFNSLGIIKFEFSNPYGVYVHDTPSKGLFGTDIRSYSHGCIRCNLPDSLARFMLRRDEQVMTPDSLDTFLARKEHRVISLRRPVSLKVDYITVTADASDKLTFHPDIYDWDAAYLKMFKSKEN
jgi:L,D-transpeptidase YcbB